MTSSVTSSYSADGLKEQSQDSAGRFCVDISAVASYRGTSRNANISRRSVLSNQTQEDKSIIFEEDSGEAIDEPDASNSSIQSRAYMNQLLLLNQSQALHIQST
ncbi:cation/H(+) antiporter 15-like [Dorcoceras hygrometricum]|uniref:Cation/H(+) antiporter 15-like n=1 Tax=Dorcoceras hygrometricum TaxID=472368 RepID=A0A2Z7A0C5_9LAMI|nr:cation/H(+) antiporter 15-like [Dorcoceras hygrometricum]